jgi:hypothetical protein
MTLNFFLGLVAIGLLAGMMVRLESLHKEVRMLRDDLAKMSKS